MLHNRSFPFAAMITFIAMALMAGRSTLAAIHRYGQFLTDSQRRALDWPLKKHSRGRKAPSYTAIRNLLKQLNPDDFAAWMRQPDIVANLRRWLQISRTEVMEVIQRLSTLTASCVTKGYRGVITR